eukprot:COSAG04_NODE_2642_length_3814_cov_3.078062_3_plen_103_part_00
MGVGGGEERTPGALDCKSLAIFIPQSNSGGLSSAQSWFGWRAHIALEDPVGTAGDQVLTPAIAAASRHIADEAEAPTLATELRARMRASARRRWRCRVAGAS